MGQRLEENASPVTLQPYPPGLKCTSLTLVLLTVDRKWKETENWQLSQLLGPSSPGDYQQRKVLEPAPSQGWAEPLSWWQPLMLLP